MEVSCSSQEQSGANNGLPPINDIGIHEFYKLIGERPSESTKKEGERDIGKKRQRQQPKEVVNEESEPPTKKRKKAVEHAFGKLETFINLLESSFKDFKKNELQIYKRDDRAFTDYPKATEVKPDVAIFTRDYSLSNQEGKMVWGSIELAIKFHTAGKTREQLLEQTATYVLYLLEARPDLVSALGLLVEPDSLDFLFCDANEIKVLNLSKKEDYLPLLSAVMKYLNDGQKKNIDATLSREQGETLFNVSVPDGSTSECPPTLYKRCSLRYSHDPFGRRPSIFIYEPKNDVTAIRVIKDQYIRKNRRWTEKDILSKIHRNGTYPAVVIMCFYGEITQAACGDRMRVRICLQDYGTDFLSMKTPRDVIYALYDLLEVTRSLYFDCGILHRDISPYNIMIRDSRYTQDIQTSSSASPVFIQHLLDPKEPKHKSSIFLIDFGYSQDLGSSDPRRGERIGTPMFVARAVQAGKPLPDDISMVFPDLPPLSGGIEAAYRSAYPKRMESFNEPLGVQIGPSQNPPSSPFRHKLEHDGESGIWCFSWWSILAFPEKAAEVPIDITNWTALLPKYGDKQSGRTGLPNADDRDTILNNFKSKKQNILHPGYGDLLGLFQSIARVILPDYHWAEDTIRQRPDFVHEILQRIILNFVVENENTLFMDQKKADENRTVFGVTRNTHLSTSQVDSRRSGSPGSSQGRKRKVKKTNPDSTTPISAMTPASSGADEFSDNQSDCYDDLDDEDTRHFEKKSRTDDIPVINVQTE